MPFIPHTDEDVRAMLAAIGAADIGALFDEIPAQLRAPALSGLPPALSEMELMRLMQQRAETSGRLLGFIGAGAYEHHIPAALWQLVSRGEFLTAYTPYQAEASQGTLQALYEYQSMMVALTGLGVCNASLYDGASALAEAVLMAVRSHKTHLHRVLIPDSVHPAYRRVVRTIVRNQNIEIVPLPFDPQSGRVAMQALEALGAAPFAALVVPQPNFFGVLEDVDALRDFAAANGALTIANVNPLSLALLKPPGEWGRDGTSAAITGGAGADICCGDGQPLGAPLAGGGPYFGFLTARESLARQMPGRIVGRSVDAEGKPAYALTLQAREQHIRRAKATSNICTNQSLLAMAAAIHMTLLGAEGLARTASACRANASSLLEHLTAVRGVERVFNAPFFHETVLRVPRPIAAVLTTLRAQGILGGFDLTRDYPQFGNAMLVCATETKSAEDIKWYAAALENALS